MKDNRLGGIALILGAVSGMITMSLHPVTGGHPITPAQFEKLAMLMIGVHVLAIAGIPFSFLGALALTRRLDSPNRLALAGLVVYSLSLVAVLIAPQSQAWSAPKLFVTSSSADQTASSGGPCEVQFPNQPGVRKNLCRGFVQRGGGLVRDDRQESRATDGDRDIRAPPWIRQRHPLVSGPQSRRSWFRAGRL